MPRISLNSHQNESFHFANIDNKNPYLSFFNHKGDEIKFKHWVAGSNQNLGLDAREPVIFKKKPIKVPFYREHWRSPEK